ncbi:MAG: tRNA (adenosine(37)-N6)-threonylcarbamoyltransferase complex dimerization subunit type 1 TsaB [Ruminococcaceae bacterium]|nr:tRNA (adenosine(37)-N6)-threonylcarbamoyltransferase complex dimerization subunit type 1 TsaB [Oscillospiraceae bacterium]
MLLAFETSAKAASVALFDREKLLGESYQNTGLTHSQTLMLMAEDLMKNCGISVSSLTGVAVAAGPGSFTGVRIGVSAAKGLSWGRDIPCWGVSSLESMALGLGVQDGYILPIMDARRAQVYTALFSVKNGVVTRVLEDQAIALTELKEKLPSDMPIFLVGDGSSLTYATLKEEIPSLVMPPEHKMHQRAVGVGLAAYRAISHGETGDPENLTPNYLRLSQAERERLEKSK